MVLDASVMIAWLLNEQHLRLGDDIYEMLAEQSISVPAHWPTEVGNALAVNLRRGRLKWSQLDAIDERLCTLDIVVAQPPATEHIRTMVQFAATHGLTVHDAAYLILAREAARVLVTVDADMRQAAQGLNIPLLPA